MIFLFLLYHIHFLNNKNALNFYRLGVIFDRSGKKGIFILKKAYTTNHQVLDLIST